MPLKNMQHNELYGMPDDADSLGSLIKWARKNSKMTLQQLADQVGSSKSYIWELENNRSEPSLWLAGQISNALGIRLQLMARLKRV